MIKKILIYAFIGIILTTIPLYYINNVLLSNSAATDKQGSISSAVKELVEPDGYRVAVPCSANNISLLHNQDYIAYIDSGNLVVKDIRKNEIYRTISDSSEVIYALPLEDRNIIMYFTYDGKKLNVKTYNMDSNVETDHKEIPVEKLRGIRDVKYSSLTNVIYIDTEIGNVNAVKDKIYRVDIMKRISSYFPGKVISGMGLLNYKDTLVYQDMDNNVYIKGKVFKYNENKKFRLLGTDENDFIYLSPVDDLSRILVVKDGAVSDVRHIDDPGYISCLSKDGGVYIVYSDHMIDLSNNKSIKIKLYNKILDINGSSVLCSDGTGEVVVEKI